MAKRVATYIQYGLLATLLVYGLMASWGGPALYTFISIIVLGIVLGLLFLIYSVKNLTFSQKLASHLGASAIAILIVCLFNGWLQVDWEKFFTWLLILSGLALLGYIGYLYLKNKGPLRKTPTKEKAIIKEDSMASPETPVNRQEFDLATGEVLSTEAKGHEGVVEDFTFEEEYGSPVETSKARVVTDDYSQAGERAWEEEPTQPAPHSEASENFPPPTETMTSMDHNSSEREPNPVPHDEVEEILGSDISSEHLEGVKQEPSDVSHEETLNEEDRPTSV